MTPPVHTPAWWAQYARECAEIARKHRRLRDARQFERIAAGLDQFAMNYAALCVAGDMLSNVAHHFKQSPAPTAEAARSALEAQEHWDEIRRATPRGDR